LRAEAPKCPICARTGVEAFKPFCSKRCADADLLSWLKGGYAIPGAPVTDAEPDEDDQQGG
jgi:endogenous inhibitor of DNA gyrase (YacG/DUF329 family)